MFNGTFEALKQLSPKNCDKGKTQINKIQGVPPPPLIFSTQLAKINISMETIFPKQNIKKAVIAQSCIFVQN